MFFNLYALWLHQNQNYSKKCFFLYTSAVKTLIVVSISTFNCCESCSVMWQNAHGYTKWEKKYYIHSGYQIWLQICDVSGLKSNWNWIRTFTKMLFFTQVQTNYESQKIMHYRVLHLNPYHIEACTCVIFLNKNIFL